MRRELSDSNHLLDDAAISSHLTELVPSPPEISPCLKWIYWLQVSASLQHQKQLITPIRTEQESKRLIL